MREIKFINAILVAIIGGWFGMQHFYVKQTVLGVLGVVFFWTGIPAIVAMVQSLVWLFNGKEEFEKRFNKQIV